MNVDLHCHSTHSDGTWSVTQILKEAERKGIEVLCISDHDNFNGSLEAYTKADGLYSGILVPGIEISTVINKMKVHLLAYFPSFNLDFDADLFVNLEKIRNSRVWRMKEMLKKAQALGFDITYEEVLNEAGTGIEGDQQPTDVISRPHLARLLVKKGYVSDMNEAFDKYLADGKPIQVDRFTLDFNEWIVQVKKLGGILIWAHPLHGHEENKHSLERIARILSGSYIDGVERIYNYKGKYTISEEFERWGERFLDELIPQNNWLITSGGDFHGNVGRLGELELDEQAWKDFQARLFIN